MNMRFPFLRWPAPTSKTYDILAAMPAIAYYVFAASKMTAGIARKLDGVDLREMNAAVALPLLAQVAALLFVLMVLIMIVLRAPAKSKSTGLMPRIMAICGTYFGIAVVWLPPQPTSGAVAALSLCLIIGGMGFSMFSLLHLGRSFSLMAEARRLVTDGPYAWIRHPLYLGEAVSLLGVTLQYRSALAFLIMALQCAFQFRRMANEEKILAQQFPEYDHYRLRTARIVPGVF
jgi:protein-S-isoprenylcysteine O-methyltransferase Ste14